MRAAAGQRATLWRFGCAAGLAAVLLGVSGCHHRENTAQMAPPQALPPELPAPAPGLPPARIPITPVPPGGINASDLNYVATHRPILSEVGYATWYTAPYKGRHAANGEVFDDLAMTAAHRTLPMGSLVVVTNMSTGQSSAMRITDRGPFVEGRLLDLTIASAKATGVYRTGMAQVRMDVYETPKPIETRRALVRADRRIPRRGRGAEAEGAVAAQYPGSNVIEFPGEKSYWVRIRPEGDDRAMAEYIARHLEPVEGDAFLTRLD